MSKQKTLENINRYLKLYSQEQLDLIEKIIVTYSNGMVGKGEIMKMVFTPEQKNKMDSALPHDYVMRVKKLLPCFDTFAYVYDYNEPTPYGAMKHIFEALHEKLQLLDNKYFEEEKEEMFHCPLDGKAYSKEDLLNTNFIMVDGQYHGHTSKK